MPRQLTRPLINPWQPSLLYFIDVDRTKRALLEAYGRRGIRNDYTDNVRGIPVVHPGDPEFHRIRHLRDEHMVQGYLIWTHFVPLDIEDPLHFIYEEVNKCLTDYYTRERQFNPWIIARLLNVYENSNHIYSAEPLHHYKKPNQRVWDDQLWCFKRSYSDLRTLMRNKPYHACMSIIDIICNNNKNSGAATLNVPRYGTIKAKGKTALIASCTQYIESAHNHYDLWHANICINMAKTKAEIEKLNRQKNRGPVRKGLKWYITTNYSKTKIEECRFMQLTLLLQLLYEFWYGDMGSTAAAGLKDSILLERRRYEYHKATLKRKLLTLH